MISRIDIIGGNGNDGSHYRFLPKCYGEWGKVPPMEFCPSCKWVGHCKETTEFADEVDRMRNNDNMADIHPTTH